LAVSWEYIKPCSMKQPELKLIYKGIKEKKAKIKTIREMYKNALENHKNYPSILEDFNALKAKKTLIESKIKDEMEKDFDIIDDLKREIQEDERKLADMAIKELVNGNDANINDDWDNELEPIFKVKYKKV